MEIHRGPVGPVKIQNCQKRGSEKSRKLIDQVEKDLVLLRTSQYHK